MKLDTRTKIVTSREAAVLTHGKSVKQVTGHFDPLLIEHVRRLRDDAAPHDFLVVVVTNSQSPLLPQRARAELVAALANVDYVVMSDSPPTEESDSSLTTEFINLVVNRYAGAAG